MDLRTVALPLYEAKGWIKFLGGVLVGVGVLYALTIVGLVVAWLFLWLGMLLWQAGREIDSAYPQGEQVPLSVAFQKLRRFFKIAGIATLAYIAVAAVALLLWALLLLWG